MIKKMIEWFHYGEAGVGVCDINIHRNVSNVVYLCTVVRVISSWLQVH